MSRIWKIAEQQNALVPDWTYYVEVCSFTFRFDSLAEVEEYLHYLGETQLKCEYFAARKKYRSSPIRCN